MNHVSSRSAYARGVLARQSSTALLSNPFTRGTLLWDDWRMGWLDADLQPENDPVSFHFPQVDHDQR